LDFLINLEEKTLAMMSLQSLHTKIPPLFYFAHNKMLCCGDITRVIVPMPKLLPQEARVYPSRIPPPPINPPRQRIIFTEHDPSPPELKVVELKEEIKPEADGSEKIDIKTIMDPTSVQDIKIRVSRLPPLPRSPRRLCTTRLPEVPRQLYSS